MQPVSAPLVLLSVILPWITPKNDEEQFSTAQSQLIAHMTHASGALSKRCGFVRIITLTVRRRRSFGTRHAVAS